MPQRARRIPNEEWEIWKEKLVKLFVEDDVPRKEIVAKMAEQHQFIITEVQLKNRLKKWGVNKNIPQNDMSIMLSLKRKRQSVGKDALFQYKGHDVEQERIERACKRQRGPLLSPDFIPPYIKMYTSRQHSPQDALDGALWNSTNNNGIALQNFDMPLLEPYRMRRSPSFATHNSFEFDFNFDVSQVVRESDGHSVSHAGQPSGDLATAEALVAPSLKLERTEYLEGFIPSIEMHVDHSRTSRVLRDAGSREHLSTSESFRASSPHVSSIDWQELVNFSPSIGSSSGAPATTSRFLRSTSRPLSTSRGYTRSLPRLSLDDSIVGASRRQESSQSMTSQKYDGRVTFLAIDSVDPESIVLPLQLLRSSYVDFLELYRMSRSRWRDWSGQGPTVGLLYSTFHSDWLLLEIENLLCWGYEKAAQAIRRRQAARSGSGNETGLLLTSEDGYEREVPANGRQPIKGRDFETRLKPKLTRRVWHRTSMGMLNMALSTPRRDSPCFGTSDAPFEIKLSFIPQSRQRATGLSAVFKKDSSISQVCRIPPCLRTFNVIPDDSTVINCILRNDMSGVQRLFGERRASPLDVDSRGGSLLSYALQHESSDLFRLLLEGGAGTQNCMM